MLSEDSVSWRIKRDSPLRAFGARRIIREFPRWHAFGGRRINRESLHVFKIAFGELNARRIKRETTVRKYCYQATRAVLVVRVDGAGGSGGSCGSAGTIPELIRAQHRCALQNCILSRNYRPNVSVGTAWVGYFSSTWAASRNAFWLFVDV